jgi:hypothetical protein
MTCLYMHVSGPDMHVGRLALAGICKAARIIYVRQLASCISVASERRAEAKGHTGVVRLSLAVHVM